MKYLVVALPNDSELAGWLGKKGGENGITFYNRRQEDTVMTILTPSNLNEKFYALGEILTLADVAVISTKSIDADFGESVIASSLLNKKVLFTNDNDVSSIINKIALNHKVIEKERILDEIISYSKEKKNGEELLIDIDKVFPVKGVGLVLLGIVRSGTVKVHDKLYTRFGKEVQVRSIQVQDEDRELAEQGARVGLAVKGIEEKDIEKGELLAKKQIKEVSEFEAELSISPLQKEISEEMQYTLAHNFDVVPCKIQKIDAKKYRIKLGKNTQMISSDKFILLKEKAPRIIGSGTIIRN